MDQWIEHLQSSNAECELHLLDDSSTLLKSQGLLEATECDVEELEPPSAVPLLPALSLSEVPLLFPLSASARHNEPSSDSENERAAPGSD